MLLVWMESRIELPKRSQCIQMSTLFYLLLPLLMVALCEQVAAQPTPAQFEISVDKYLMGTLVKATVRHHDIKASKAALYHAFVEMERVEALLSVHNEDSEVSLINRFAGQHPVTVSEETFSILARAKGYAEQFDGLFDVTIGPVTALWGFSTESPANRPDEDLLKAALALVSYREMILNEADTTVYLTMAGMRLDLGGIAKGYAIDRGVQVLQQKGIQQFLLNAGGDMYGADQKDAEQEWRVGIKHPRDQEALLAQFNLRDGAVATSGDYERFMMVGDQRYHHIINPQTGYPGTHARSVTVLAPTAEEADVWATYLFLRGPGSKPATAVALRYVLVDATGQIHVSDAFLDEAHFQLMQ